MSYSRLLKTALPFSGMVILAAQAVPLAIDQRQVLNQPRSKWK